MSNTEATVSTRPIHYLGSKLRMLEAVKLAVDTVDPAEGTICDLFSGSGTVSKFFINYRNVISSDIQMYSSVLCEAEMSCLNSKLDVDMMVDEMSRSSHYALLQSVFTELLKYEAESMEDAQKGNIDPLFEIIENGSIYVFEKEDNQKSENLNQQLMLLSSKLKKNNLQDSLEIMLTRYYGGLYFSYKQALDLDCIEHFIFLQEGVQKTKMLAALLSTASEIVNTVGKQFAQPLKVRNTKGEYKRSLLQKVLEDRTLNVFELYKKWLKHYVFIETSRHNFEIICDDYKKALELLKDKKVSVIYADPPYTRYHYSRYYHVLESICLRDNPQITTTFPNGKGGISRAIYREGRHQSPFCIKSQAEKAFEKLFEGVSQLDVPLVLSYSPFEPSQAVTPRLQTIDQLIEMAKKYFTDVTAMSPGEFTHSKLNSSDKNFETNHEAEILILCKN